MMRGDKLAAFYVTTRPTEKIELLLSFLLRSLRKEAGSGNAWGNNDARGASRWCSANVIVFLL